MSGSLYEGSDIQEHLERARKRSILLTGVFVMAFLGVCLRLFQVMIINNKNYYHVVSLEQTEGIHRADIVDRNGELIATSIPTISVYAVPKDILNAKEAAVKLCGVFPELKVEKLIKQLSNNRSFVWIKRHISPIQKELVLSLGIPGVNFLDTERRVYPDKNLCSHVIGFTDIDNNGIAGLEKSMDTLLSSSSEKLQASIDIRVQHVVRDEVAKAIEKFKAVAGAGLVLDIKTSEVIALVSLPDFDPNLVKDPSRKENFNILTSSALEPGSSAKIINTALALEKGGVKASTKFDARFPLKVGRFTIHDYHGKYTYLSVEEILKYSSNIGSAKMALAVGVEQQKKFFKDLGLLDKMPFELSEMQKPIYPKDWTEVSAITISYGHGIALNPLQFAVVVAGLVNDGIMHYPTLIKFNSSCERLGKRIVSEETSKQLNYMMRINVLDGTNKKADAEGYLVGGKTGTAEKNEKGRYNKDENVNFFVGVFPADKPMYLVYVILDNPKGIKETYNFAAAGWNVAPTAAKIVTKIAGILGVKSHFGTEPNWHLLLK